MVQYWTNDSIRNNHNFNFRNQKIRNNLFLIFFIFINITNKFND